MSCLYIWVWEALLHLDNALWCCGLAHSDNTNITTKSGIAGWFPGQNNIAEESFLQQVGDDLSSLMTHFVSRVRAYIAPPPVHLSHFLCIKAAPQPSSLLQFPSQKNNLYFGTDSIVSFPLMLWNFPPGSQYSCPFSLILKSQSLSRSQLMPKDPKNHQLPTVHPTYKYLNFLWI